MRDRTERTTAEPSGGDHPDDAALLAAAKADRRAFGLLYARYVGNVYRFCDRRLGDPAAAEDATSQVFLRALAALSTCRDDRFAPWLFAIARNVVADTFRRGRPVAPLAVAGEVVDPAVGPEEAALIADDRRSLHALLIHLTPDQRRVVELRLAGLTGPEIAEALGLSHAAVKVHQFRAVARLRAALGINPTATGSIDVPDKE